MTQCYNDYQIINRFISGENLGFHNVKLNGAKFGNNWSDAIMIVLQDWYSSVSDKRMTRLSAPSVADTSLSPKRTN